MAPPRTSPRNTIKAGQRGSMKRGASTIISPLSKVRKSRQSKASPVDEVEDDSASVDTAIVMNISTNDIRTHYVTFLSFQFKVEGSKKGSETMRKMIKALFKILQDADEAVAFSTYKTTITYEDEDQPTPIAAKEVIKDPDSVPESITAMRCLCLEYLRVNM